VELKFWILIVVILAIFHIYRLLHRKSMLVKLINEKENEMSRTIRISEKIIEINNKMMNIDNRDTLLELILKKAIEVVEYAESGSVMFLKPDGNCEFLAAVGYDLEKLKKVEFNVQDTFIYRKTNGIFDKAYIIDDIMDYNRSVKSYVGKDAELVAASVVDIHTTISAPIFVDNKVYGFINLDSTKENAYTENDLIYTDMFVGEAGMAIKNHLMLQEIVQLSRYDSLTGIYNRRYFIEMLEQSIERGTRYNEKFLVVIFDLNGLKKINDDYGHLVGDGLIRYFTNKIQNSIRKSDVFARYGGDEFVGIFYNSDSIELKKNLDEITRWFSENLFQFETDSIKCSFSYGISEFPDDTTRYDALIKIADDRMYKHKRGLKFSGK